MGHRIGVCVLVLSAAAWGPAARGQNSPDPAAAAIGGLAVNALVATNLNIGLAVELLNAKNEQLPVVLTVMQQTESTVGVTVKQLEDYRAKVRLPKDAAEYLERVLGGLKGVEAQARSFQKAVKEKDQKLMDEFQGHRAQVAEVIKGLTKG
jgi:hypothetical protein